MRPDSRLSRMLHALLHMEAAGGPMTSESLARMLATNPVVVRRTMAGLREQGLVTSEKGHGGGWVLARRLEEVTLLDIYAALGDPRLFAIGLSADRPECLVEQAVNAAVGDTLAEAEALVRQRFAQVTLRDLSRDFEDRLRSLRPGR
ncbi:Rrf2 family transcriptional regulator [Phenylobacterium sp.]|uniref:Rrf2 family transcriptional regulator n=1 Tax=Phenylobacterium sp. TaxID=1871053 RepID=UPI002FDB4FB9